MKDGSTSGSLSPDCANINFAVRSIKTLSSFNIGEFDIPSKIEPGIIDPILDTFSYYATTLKKVTAGVDGTDGDVWIREWDSSDTEKVNS